MLGGDPSDQVLALAERSPSLSGTNEAYRQKFIWCMSESKTSEERIRQS